MRIRTEIAFAIVPLAAACFAGSACAMNTPSNALVECRVIGGEKLPAASGGSDAFCAAIARAAAIKAPNVRFKVEARFRGNATMVATLTTADGKTLPEQEYGISDGTLSAASFDRFADHLVEMVAPAGSR